MITTLPQKYEGVGNECMQIYTKLQSFVDVSLILLRSWITN